MEAVAPHTPCPRCRGSGALVESERDFARAVLCTCQAHCARCEGSGRQFKEKDGYSYVVACACQQVRKGIALYNAARLPAVLAGRDFDSIKPHFAELETAREQAREFAMTYVPGRTHQGLLFAGPVGTGKTHLLAAILGYLTLEMRVSCRYVEISFLYSEIRGGFSQGRSSLDIIAPLAEIPVLAIDELGKGKMSPFEQETIDELISRRYNASRATLFATNYSTSDRPERPAYSSTSERAGEQKAELPLKDRVGERVYSRLHQMCRFVEFPASARDYRRSTVRH